MFGIRRQILATQVISCIALVVSVSQAIMIRFYGLHTTSLIVGSDPGHASILIGGARRRIVGNGSETVNSIVFRDDKGVDRVIAGEQPSPLVNGKLIYRKDKVWGMTVLNSSGSERGGFGNFDNGRTVVALDRPTGDGVGLLVDERSGFAGLAINYDSGRIGSYKSAAQIGTESHLLQNDCFSFDGEPSKSCLLSGQK